MANRVRVGICTRLVSVWTQPADFTGAVLGNQDTSRSYGQLFSEPTAIIGVIRAIDDKIALLSEFRPSLK